MTPYWTLEEAVEICCLLTHRFLPIGYLVALTGSVLTKGRSRKDLDLVVYPYTTAVQDQEAVRLSLVEMGMVLRFPVATVHARWRSIGSKDEKHVEVWMFGMRRIDLFFLK